MTEDTVPAGLYFHDAGCLEHDPGAELRWVPERPERVLAIERHLQQRGWLGWERRAATAANEAEVKLIHSQRHIERIRDLAASGGGPIDSETWVGEGSYRAALHAAGGACAMARALTAGQAQRGFCGVRPPGHHAERERAMGFCLFNNVAIATELAICELGVERVFILDWDVHHGNGTAEAFRHRNDVLYASIHESGSFPGTGQAPDVGSGAGEGFTINLPVPPGSEGELWLSLLEHVVMPAADQFDPDLILISAGYDAHERDPLCAGRLQTEIFAEMACQTRDLAQNVQAPVGAVLEGGYEPEVLAEYVAATLQALGGEEPATSAAPEALLTSRAAARVAHYWEL
jgi:acetoin utilization deacetylase AcuC-like enzyme